MIVIEYSSEQAANEVINLDDSEDCANLGQQRQHHHPKHANRKAHPFNTQKHVINSKGHRYVLSQSRCYNSNNTYAHNKNKTSPQNATSSSNINNNSFQYINKNASFDANSQRLEAQINAPRCSRDVEMEILAEGLDTIRSSQSIEGYRLDTIPGLYACKQNPDDRRPVLKPQEYS